MDQGASRPYVIPFIKPPAASSADHVKRWQTVPLRVHSRPVPPPVTNWMERVAGFISAMIGEHDTQTDELKFDMYDPAWHIHALSLGVSDWPRVRMQYAYAEVLAWRRYQMKDVHLSYVKLIDTWDAQAESASGRLQCLPAEKRLDVLNACLAGETPLRQLKVLRTLELVNRSWAVMVNSARSRLTQRAQLAQTLLPILWHHRDGIRDDDQRLAGKLDDLRWLSEVWGLPIKDMKPEHLATFRICQGDQQRGIRPRPALDTDAVLLWVPHSGAQHCDAWRALVESEGSELRHLGIRLLEFNSPLSDFSLEHCPKLQGLQLSRFHPNQIVITDDAVKEKDFGALGNLPQLQILDIPAVALEKIPPPALERLRHLVLDDVHTPPPQTTILKGMSQLLALELRGGYPEHSQVKWLKELPSALQILKVEVIDQPASIVLPNSLRSLEVTKATSCAGLVLPENLSELILETREGNGAVTLACDWLAQAGQRASSLKLNALMETPLTQLLNQLQGNRTLQCLKLPMTSWNSISLDKLVTFVAHNHCLSRLELEIHLQKLDPLNLILKAITASSSLRHVCLGLRVEDSEFAVAASQRMLNWGLDNPDLEWSSYGNYNCLQLSNWPAKVPVNV